MDKQVMDLTQDDDSSDAICNLSTTDTDAMFDQILPPVSRLDSGISTGSSLNSEPVSYGTRKKRKSLGSSAEEKGKKKTKELNDDKKAKRQKLLEDKAAKQASNDFNKIYKPGECMKYMNVEFHPTLLSTWFMADVTREVESAGANIICQATASPDKNLCFWTRTLPQKLASSDGVVQLTPKKESCNRGVFFMVTEYLAELVEQHRLSQRMIQIASEAGYPVTLVVFGVKDYFKQPSRKTKKSPKKLLMTEIEMEMAFTDLLVTANCDTVIVDQPIDIALLIVNFTKAIAEAPFKEAKRACDEQADFYMRGDNKNCIRVDKNGRGLSSLWQQMIAILPHSSLEISRAVCAQYKSPLHLYEALQSPDGLKDLSDLGVARTDVPGSKARRLGPEFARKLKILFTSENGDDLVN